MDKPQMPGDRLSGTPKSVGLLARGENQQVLFTYSSLSKATELCEKTLSNEVKAGRLRATRIGRTVRFAPEDVQKWIDAAKEPAQEKGAADA